MRQAAAAVLAAILVISIGMSVKAAEIDISVKSAILVDCDSGKVLYEENADEQLAPASVTKVMTMLLIMEAIERGEIGYDTVVTASERAKSMGGSTIYLDTGEQMSVDDLLKGIAVASGNDACVAMAEHLSGSVEAFVDVMNNRAAELGMVNTHFVTCNGLDADGHYSSARDIAIMSRELLKHEDILRYTGIWMDSLRDGKFQLANTNKLIRYYDGATGLKTGSTSKAGNCISATAERNGTRLCAVVLGSPNSKARFAAASTLLNYGFENYTSVGSSAGEAAGVVKVKKGESENVTCVLEEACRATVEKGAAGVVETEIELAEEAEAPIGKGEKMGVMKLILNGEVIAEADIVAGEDVHRVSFGKMYIE
ncbi:MAG: D-alanyl-D-alanine carboxypeptidase [Clostridia bacterium]|nr:D-alanyl-D-alanine carboxypeptidase [Clostridia bacterium]